MVDEQPSADSQQQREGDTHPISESSAVKTNENVTPAPDGNNSSKKPETGAQPPRPPRTHNLIVELKENPDKPTSQIERKTLRIAYYGLGLAAITGAIFLGQFVIMSHQTQILSTDAITGVANSTRADAFSQKQIEALQSQVTAIQKQMRQDQRAWIKVDIGQIMLGVDQAPTFDMTIRNEGKSPAKNIVSLMAVERVDADKVPNFGKHRRAVAVETTGAIFQNDFVSQKISSRKVDATNNNAEPDIWSQKDVDGFYAGNFYLIFRADVSYVDIFGIKHLTKFCQFSATNTKDISIPAGKCTAYNSVDNN